MPESIAQQALKQSTLQQVHNISAPVSKPTSTETKPITRNQSLFNRQKERTQAVQLPTTSQVTQIIDSTPSKEIQQRFTALSVISEGLDLFADLME